MSLSDYCRYIPRHCLVELGDSKLTRLLRDSLGGSAATTMVVCVSQGSGDLFKSRRVFFREWVETGVRLYTVLWKKPYADRDRRRVRWCPNRRFSLSLSETREESLEWLLRFADEGSFAPFLVAAGPRSCTRTRRRTRCGTRSARGRSQTKWRRTGRRPRLTRPFRRPFDSALDFFELLVGF